MEKSQLIIQLEATKEMNQELQRQLRESSCTASSDVQNGKRSLSMDGLGERNDIVTKEKALGSSEDDLLEVPRMRRRILQAENELKRTKTKLLGSQTTLKVISIGKCDYNAVY